MLLLELRGSEQPPQHVRVVDAVLVTVMEHGITPSTLAARLVLDGAPESIQGAVAAGLLAAGSRFLGVVEDAAVMFQRIAGENAAENARLYVSECLSAGRHVPGFGHNLHSHEDPRVATLLTLAEAEGVCGKHVRAIGVLHDAVSEALGRTLLINAAAPVAAILSDLGYAPDEIRGLAIVARAAGLLAHVVDERKMPMARQVWKAAHDAQC